MNDLQNLKTFIGQKRTLIIAGPEFETEKYTPFEDRLFIHLTHEGRIRRYDPEQREMLEYYIQRKDCSQLIFVGSKHPTLIKRIEEDDSLSSASTALKFNLSVLLRHKHDKIIHPTIYQQMLSELHVANQCRLLLDHFFIKRKVDKKKLVVRGVITALDGMHFKSVYHNGIVYNDILTLN